MEGEIQGIRLRQRLASCLKVKDLLEPLEIGRNKHESSSKDSEENVAQTPR